MPFKSARGLLSGALHRASVLTCTLCVQTRKPLQGSWCLSQGPGSKLVIQRGRTKKTPWTLGFDPPLPSLDPKKLDGKGLSYSIAFADLHETAVIRTASFAKVKKVSLYRQQSYYGRMEFGFTTLLTTGSPPACIL